MKKYFHILLIVFCYFQLNAQLEIGIFPINFTENIELKYTVDYIDNSLIEQTGAHLIWDISKNVSPIIEELKINKQGALNEKYLNTYEVDNGITTLYFNKNRRDFDEIGFLFKVKGIGSKSVLYDNPLSFSTRNLIYGATFSDNSSFSIILDREYLPVELTRNLPQKIQSVKLVAEINREYHCDANGKFIFKSKSVSALRMKVDEKTSLRLYDVVSGNEIPHIDDSILKEIYPNYGHNKYFLFYSNSAKYYFAKVNYFEGTNSYIVRYQTTEDKNDIFKINDRKKIFLIYPNPTYDIAKLLVSNYPNGEYTLGIYNIIGKNIWNEKVYISNNTLLKYDFSYLRKGTYLIALKDKYGNIIATRKLVIISI